MRVRLSAAMVAVLCCAVVAVGCGSSGSGSGGGGSSSSGPKQVRVGFVVKRFIEYYRTIKSGADRAAAHDNVQLKFDAAQSDTDVPGQIAKINAMVARGIDVLMVAPIGPQLIPTLNKVEKRGIPVISIADIPGLKAPWVGTPNADGGVAAANYIADKLKGKGTVAIMAGVAGVPELDDRVTAAVKTFKARGIKVVTTLATDCIRQKGASVMQDILNAHPDVSAIYSVCGLPMLGALPVIDSSPRAKVNRPLIVGFDASKEELPHIAAGDEDASVGQFPVQIGVKALQAAIKLAKGQPVPHYTNTGIMVVDKSNLAEFETKSK